MRSRQRRPLCTSLYSLEDDAIESIIEILDDKYISLRTIPAADEPDQWLLVDDASEWSVVTPAESEWVIEAAPVPHESAFDVADDAAPSSGSCVGRHSEGGGTAARVGRAHQRRRCCHHHRHLHCHLHAIRGVSNVLFGRSVPTPSRIEYVQPARGLWGVRCLLRCRGNRGHGAVRTLCHVRGVQRHPSCCSSSSTATGRSTSSVAWSAERWALQRVCLAPVVISAGCTRSTATTPLHYERVSAISKGTIVI